MKGLRTYSPTSARLRHKLGDVCRTQEFCTRFRVNNSNSLAGAEIRRISPRMSHHGPRLRSSGAHPRARKLERGEDPISASPPSADALLANGMAGSRPVAPHRRPFVGEAVKACSGRGHRGSTGTPSTRAHSAIFLSKVRSVAPMRCTAAIWIASSVRSVRSSRRR
jgi:hypothetical protein